MLFSLSTRRKGCELKTRCCLVKFSCRERNNLSDWPCCFQDMYLLRSAEDKPPGQHSLGENGLIPKPGSCSWREQWPTQPQIYTRVHTLLLLILLKHTFCPFRMKVTLISLVNQAVIRTISMRFAWSTHPGSKHSSSPCIRWSLQVNTSSTQWPWRHKVEV